MAIVESNKATKVKLVHLKNGDDGVQRQSTRTFSNIVSGASNDKLMEGMKAVISLQTGTPAAIVRVEETTLSEQV